MIKSISLARDQESLHLASQAGASTVLFISDDKTIPLPKVEPVTSASTIDCNSLPNKNLPTQKWLAQSLAAYEETYDPQGWDELAWLLTTENPAALTFPSNRAIALIRPAHLKAVESFAQHNFRILLLYHTVSDPALFTHISPLDLHEFFRACRAHHLQAGLIGHFEPPDIPRILLFQPNFLGFWPPNDMLTTLVTQHTDPPSTITATDRLIVEDFILPMEIGAYQSEHGKKQRVRFNVVVDIVRPTTPPKDMHHVFSYDIILDVIRTLASQGHIVLVEDLAERIAGFLLTYPQIQQTLIRVEKLDLGPGAVGIEIRRRRFNQSAIQPPH
ncbi:dihydroneopterin aldolase [Bartonella sp. DGB2]|uniref:dihydroneopterin aldolase n=1 Tax=Bartonella sp. DGB2 TaxID=3388426 RepID=UPI00398FAD18